MLPVKEAGNATIAEDVWAPVWQITMAPRSRPSPSQPHASTRALVLSGVIAYIVLRPLLGLGDELAVTALAWIFHVAVGTGA